jgi:hypothetical protein
MALTLASVDYIRFDIEDALEKQIYATLTLPFPGIDSKSKTVYAAALFSILI